MYALQQRQQCGFLKKETSVELASFLPSMSSVWAARCEQTKQIVVLWNWNRTPTPPLLPCHPTSNGNCT